MSVVFGERHSQGEEEVMMESAIWSMGDKFILNSHKIKIVLYINYQIVSSRDYNIISTTS